MTLGSMQLCVLWFCATRAQLVTTPPKRPSVIISSSAATALNINVGPGEQLAHDGRCEQSSMLDNHVVIHLVVGELQLVQESVGWLSDDYGGEELSSEPCASSRTDGLLDNRDFHVRVLTKFVGTAESCRSSSDHNHVGVSVGDHVSHIPASYLPDDGLLDRGEFIVVEVVLRILVQGSTRSSGLMRNHSRTRSCSNSNPINRGCTERELFTLNVHEGANVAGTLRSTKSSHICQKILNRDDLGVEVENMQRERSESLLLVLKVHREFSNEVWKETKVIYIRATGCLPK
ncbi:hypothetical protein R1flu_017419 [Riccia fluitans]|uniref:Secreted protein n=1 Tax=Riccia fluitans TaxID=41844 RepID=A0ABD1ZCX2_9MARC